MEVTLYILLSGLIGLGLSAEAGPPKPEDLTAVICGPDKPCRVVNSQSAGTDAQGRDLWIVEIARHTKDLESAKQPAFGLDCAAYGYWLVVTNKGKIQERRPVLELCNDGYGAAGLGEDSVEVGPNRLTHGQLGGSAWRWSTGRILQLSPPRLLAEDSSGYWALGANHDSQTWSWETFTGTHTWFAPECVDGEVPDMDDGSSTKEFHSVAIPAIKSVQPALVDTWKNWSLGSCAITIDSTGAGGFIIHGEPADAKDARLRLVVLGERDLLVEVEDDTVISGAKSWLFDDHLELWTAPSLGFFDHCLETGVANKAVRQWGIRLSDGNVFLGKGEPATTDLAVERHVSASGHVRLRIRLPEGVQHLAVVYSDSDDKKTQERLIATSAVVFGKAATIGSLYELSDKQATCEVRADKLEVRQISAFPPKGPLLE